jgi:hypothetical protein
MRIEGYACSFSERANLLKGAVKMCTGLGVHRDDVGPGVGECLNIFLGFDDHEVDINHLLGRCADCFHDRRANRDVGHETAVHDIDVNPVGACLVDRLDFSLKTAKISGKDGGGDSERL